MTLENLETLKVPTGSYRTVVEVSASGEIIEATIPQDGACTE